MLNLNKTALSWSILQGLFEQGFCGCTPVVSAGRFHRANILLPQGTSAALALTLCLHNYCHLSLALAQSLVLVEEPACISIEEVMASSSTSSCCLIFWCLKRQLANINYWPSTRTSHTTLITTNTIGQITPRILQGDWIWLWAQIVVCLTCRADIGTEWFNISSPLYNSFDIFTTTIENFFNSFFLLIFFLLYTTHSCLVQHDKLWIS